MGKTLIGRVSIDLGKLPDFMEAGEEIEVIPDTAFYEIPLVGTDALNGVAFYQWVKWLSEGKQVVVSAYYLPVFAELSTTGNVFRVTVLDNGIATPVDADGVLIDNTLNFVG